ncbi:class I adenylate-forming enzyme family protein [Spongiactinospora sp. TRM90649]|uniref:class I adenylate-forming enzyme family protein n=1 Tax=Spongiactinospora sp. TRM90649 TaxID=3031114 RepID=UPI0023F7C72B|nr:class I adenylate-forming enzyme family protein [Spongiactinospora sp. TRM90649]MDF5754042.1 class I adenylate-forming enzyme family protein [Spongiactinospora sp. TRM90649]
MSAISNLTIPALLHARASADPDREALIVHGGGSGAFGATSGALTFAEWARGAAEVARGLAGRGVRRGDRVGLVFGNGDWIDYAVAFCGVTAAGAVAVPLSDRLADGEIRTALSHAGATTVLRAGDLPLPGGPEPEPPAPGDIAQILLTSGTTGRAKGVAATHANLTYGHGGRRRSFAHSTHLAHAFPIGTNAGQTMLVTALDAHPVTVTLPRFTPGRFAAMIENYHAGTVFLVPAMAVELLAAEVADRHDLSCVRLLGSAAAPLPGPVAARLCTAFPRAAIVNYYTSTESYPAQTIMMYDPDRPGSVGQAVGGGTVRIGTAEGEPLPPGTVGEVWLRSPAAPRSYWRDERASGAVFRDGWVRMGDLGRIDDEGYLYLVDRESDVIKSGAFKVSTLHVEETAHECPGVREAAAFGVPHPTLGMSVALALVGSVTPQEMRLFLADRLAPHERPARVLLMEALPRNHAGKIDKRLLREGAR